MILPRSNPISSDADDMLEFDGAAEILRAWRADLTPDPELTVSQWADRHRMLLDRALGRSGMVSHGAQAHHARDH